MSGPLSDDSIYLLGRWTGIVVFILLIIDVTLMEMFRLRASTMKEWLASRIYTNRLHGIISVTILLGAVLHSLLLVFGRWQDHTTAFPLWMKGTESMALMVDLGTISAGLMIFLALHGYHRKWFWKHWSHKAWQRTHFWVTMLLICIVAIHASTIGTEFRFLGLSVRN
ncbi:MAG TPA: hypothetical protein QF646_04900 [Candidatus Poseidoniales archaeon]|nr:hypothetical protein [Candidatus Poseidoniales archaeon]